MTFEGKFNLISLVHQSRTRKKSCYTVAWMNDFFQKTSEKMPNSCSWYLPSFLTKDAVFKEYKKSGQEIFVSRSQFYMLWSKYFKHVSIPAVKYLFSSKITFSSILNVQYFRKAVLLNVTSVQHFMKNIKKQRQKINKII